MGEQTFIIVGAGAHLRPGDRRAHHRKLGGLDHALLFLR